MHFIHIPKTGGTSARAALEEPQDRRWQGHYPAWAVDLPKDDMWTIVRHPYDRAISMFYNFNGKTPFKQELKKWFLSGADKPLIRGEGFVMNMMDSQSRYVCPDGDTLVGRVIKFENIISDMQKHFEVKIGHKNSSHRKKRVEDYYDQELKDIIYNKYEADFRNFGYGR